MHPLVVGHRPQAVTAGQGPQIRRQGGEYRRLTHTITEVERVPVRGQLQGLVDRLQFLLVRLVLSLTDVARFYQLRSPTTR